MIKAVLDTNILVSAFLNPKGAPAKVFDYVLNGNVIMCYDSKMITEYREVLKRPKFGFNEKDVDQLIKFILETGISVVPPPLQVDFTDQDDRVFYEVAIFVRGKIVTGNKKHFPEEPFIMSANDFLAFLEKIGLTN